MDEVYGTRTASSYDAWFGAFLDSARTVEALAALAASAGGPERGPVLELGIGTGRVALPLVAKGFRVEGIDASAEMIGQLRAKPGGDAVDITLGDFSDFVRDDEYCLIYVAAGTFFELPSQDAQLRCFESVARCLRPGGLFAFDGLLPDAASSAGQADVRMIPNPDNRLVLRFRDVQRLDQRYTSHYLIVENGNLHSVTVRFRYAWPSELDLMAKLAGLRLRERWGGWGGEAFTSTSASHVSIYERPPASESA